MKNKTKIAKIRSLFHETSNLSQKRERLQEKAEFQTSHDIARRIHSLKVMIGNNGEEQKEKVIQIKRIINHTI